MIVAFVEHDISTESANYFECTFPIGSPGLKSGPAFLVAPATRRDHRMPRLIGTLSERWGTYTKDNSWRRIGHGAYYRVVSPSWCVENPGRVRGRNEKNRARRDEWRAVSTTNLKFRNGNCQDDDDVAFCFVGIWLVVWYRSCTSALQICQLSRDKSRGI